MRIFCFEDFSQVLKLPKKYEANEAQRQEFLVLLLCLTKVQNKLFLFPVIYYKICACVYEGNVLWTILLSSEAFQFCVAIEKF